ncbi:MAG TPA: thiamine pyrophosphate-binding protein [Polyangiales bacterium]
MPPHRDERARFSSQRTTNPAFVLGRPDESHTIDRSSYIRELTPPPEEQPVASVVPLRKVEPPKPSSLAHDAAARQLIQALLERGVDTFFGVPGGPVCPVFEAIRLEPRARLIESRHESHAAFAAALFYRASGRTPAVVVTAGPGITNAMTGIASASLERTPMLVIAGDVAWATSGGVMAQDSGPEGIDMEAMLAPITRAQVRAAHARGAVSQALRALDCAEDPRHPGPALFVLPLDRAMEPCARIEVFPAIRERAAPPPTAAVVKTAAWLADAQHPLIVIGAGCRGHEAALLGLIEAAQVPFVTTPRAKGLLSEDHALSLRNGGMAASLWARRYTAEPVDVCLVLGTDLDDTSMGPTRYIGSGGRVIHVDLNARVFGRNLPTALAITGDVGTFAHALRVVLRENQLFNLDGPAAAAAAKREPACDVPEPELDDATPIRPHRLLADLQRALAPDTRFVTDIGEHMLFCLHYLTARAKDSFYVQLNLGSMGSGIAGAIGLSLADRKRRVVCVAGDGGMQMSGMEALLAVRERLPILFVVFNDGRYNMVHHGMRQIFGEASPYATPPIDFAAWARSFGMPAMAVSDPGAIDARAIDALMAHGGPALIDARIDATVRIRGGGRVEALQHMSMLSQQGKERA